MSTIVVPQPAVQRTVVVEVPGQRGERGPAGVNQFWNAVLNEGIDNTGATDVTAKLLTFFERGGELYIPDGDYYIAPAGPDAGGVYATITKSTNVVCGPSVRFFTSAPGLDNDMIRLSVPANGAGLPAGGIDVSWHGGKFDQAAQKSSTIVPFALQYPPANPGASVTCDALSFNAVYSVSGALRSGINNAVVTGVETNAGGHWQTAGGDSGLYFAGVKNVVVWKHRAVANRDLGIYISSDSTGTLPVRCTVKDSSFVSCFHGVAVKRSVQGADISSNVFDNCVRSVLSEHIAGNGCSGLSITANVMKGSNIGVRLIRTSNSVVAANLMIDAGATLADGATIEGAGGFYGIWQEGGRDNRIHKNWGVSVKPAVSAAYPTTREFVRLSRYTDISPAESATWNTVENNVSDGWRAAGLDDFGVNNSYVENLERIGAANVSPNSSVGFRDVRSSLDNITTFRTPPALFTGTPALPSIARSGNMNTGVYFDLNKVGLSAGGVGNLLAEINYTQFQRGLVLTTRIVTTGATVPAQQTDINLGINKTTGSPTAVTLPASPVTGATLTISDCKGDAATNPITISPASGLIDGGSTFVISTNFGSWSGFYTGSAWKTKCAH